MRVAMACHDELLREAVALHGGDVFSTMGDGLAAVFPSASSAVAAALAVQDGLVAEVWPTAFPIRVRMGLHTGEAEQRDNDYFGTAVNRAARLMAVGSGGQVLCSQATAALLDAEVTLLDLGEHRLRDLDRPMRVFQLGAGSFGPLRSLDAFPGNLPRQVNAFVGRDRAAAAVAEALAEVPVVTLTGVGGVGKTRLAVQVAADELPGFPDGAWLVELGGVGDVDSVEKVVATALGVQARPGQQLGSTLVDYLRARRMLLLLDNCEHLVSAVAGLVERVIAACPAVRILATSREGLAVAGERVIALAPMELPVRETLAGAAQSEAVQLFVDRAADVRPGFALTDQNAAVVGRLCRRLDGIPLALELAASRLRSMSPTDVLDHLDQRFRFLTGGRRTALSRQHTLRGAIDWSFDLLESPERGVLQRLGVFAGGFDLAAAESVAAGGGVDTYDVADLVDRLVDKSLVVAELSETTPRYRLLETVRDYAWERLVEADDAGRVSHRHAEYFLGFATSADAGLRGPEEDEWTERVELELDNLRAAVTWAVDTDHADLALGTIAALTPGFGNRIGAPFGPLAERAADTPGAVDHPFRCVALASAARSAADRGDNEQARALADAALAEAANLPDDQRGAWARCRASGGVSIVLGTQGDTQRMVELAEQRLEAANALGDAWEQTRALIMIAGLHAGEPAGAAAGEEAIRLARKVGNPSCIAFALMMTAPTTALSEPESATAMLEEAIAIITAASNSFASVQAHHNLARTHALRGDPIAAARASVAAAQLAHAGGDRGQLWSGVAGVACCLAEAAAPESALVLGTWVARNAGWPDDWMTTPQVLSGDALARARNGLTTSELEVLRRAAESLDENEALALATTSVEGLG